MAFFSLTTVSQIPSAQAYVGIRADEMIAQLPQPTLEATTVFPTPGKDKSCPECVSPTYHYLVIFSVIISIILLARMCVIDVRKLMKRSWECEILLHNAQKTPVKVTSPSTTQPYLYSFKARPLEPIYRDLTRFDPLTLWTRSDVRASGELMFLVQTTLGISAYTS